MSEEYQMGEPMGEEGAEGVASEEPTTQRKRKTPEERLKAKLDSIDTQIKKFEDKLDDLRKQREELVNPVTYDKVIAAAKKKKISPKKLAEVIDQLSDDTDSQEN